MPDSPDDPRKPRSGQGAFWHGTGGAFVAGIFGLLGTLAGILVGNTGVVQPLPGSPTQTVTITDTVTTVKTVLKASTSGAIPSQGSTTSRYHVRRTTGANPVTIRSTYSLDLDSERPDWEIGQHNSISRRFDLFYDDVVDSIGLSGYSNGDIAIVTGPKSAETCAAATAYGGVATDKLRAGLNFCARTSDHRLAYLTVTAFDVDVRDSITLAVTVWDPPGPQSG
jgi:hypothetical protein